MLIIVNSLLFTFSLFGILLVIILYPLFIWILYLVKYKKPIKVSSFNPTISLMTVVHNAQDLIVEKINNLLSLNYPSDNVEIIIFSDGSTDKTENNVKPFINEKIHYFSSTAHEGKNKAINETINNCSGEIIIFSDADAYLDSDAIKYLTKYFVDPEIGGVCGQRIICKDNKKLKKAQSDYIKFDSLIKKLESQTGNISSNDGKLYAFKKDLFKPIHPAVTDDLYMCLSIIKQNYRFIFEPEAKAFIKIPSRNPVHEIQRRRRIVCRSLRGILLNKDILNPFKYGFFSLSLFINKIMRRFLPVFLLSMFFSSCVLSFYNHLVGIVLFLQI